MSYQEFKAEIQQSIKEAMLAKNQHLLDTLRSISAGLTNAEKSERNIGKELDPLSVVAALARQRQQSIIAYTEAGNKAMADSEQTELGIIESYLPKKLTEPEIDGVISLMVTSEFIGATAKDKGRVVNAFKEKHSAQNMQHVMAAIAKYLK